MKPKTAAEAFEDLEEAASGLREAVLETPLGSFLEGITRKLNRWLEKMNRKRP